MIVVYGILVKFGLEDFFIDGFFDWLIGENVIYVSELNWII